MSDPSLSPLPRASSEPDLSSLPERYEAELPELDLHFEQDPLGSAEQAALTLSLTPLTLPNTQAPGLFATASVSFTEYVATELARSAALPSAVQSGADTREGLARFLGPDEAGLVRGPQPSPHAPVSPRSPRSPRTVRSPRARNFGSTELFAAAVPPVPSEAEEPETNGSSTNGAPAAPYYMQGARHNKLSCIEIDETGAKRLRSLTRMDILKESRETLHKSHPSPSAAAAWMRQLDGEETTPQMDSFASLMDGPLPGDSDNGEGARGPQQKKALREYLRKYLRNSLQPRDIRQVDPAFAPKPALWIRHTALVISMEGLRAIVFRSKILLFQPDAEKTLRAAEMAQNIIMVRGDIDNPQPFEFKALESILIHVLSGLERDFCVLKPEIERNLRELPNELSTSKLEELRLQKQRLNQFHSRATSVQDILEKVLDEDEDMANMYLTEKHTSPKRARSVMDHDEVEMLLEAYLQGVDELVNQSRLLSDGIEDTEDLVMIHLDTLRNRLLSVELALSVVSMTFGVGSVLSGIFGMNLPIPLFDEGASSYWFLTVVLVIFAFVVGVSWFVLRVLRLRGLYSFK